MKLWVRLSLLTVTVLFLSTGISGLWVIQQTVRYNEEKAIENYRQQLLSAAGGIGREIENSSYETYGEVTRSAFYKYLIRKYGSTGYILLQDHQVKCNMTDYELIDPSGLRWDESHILQEKQNLGDVRLLILGEKIAVNIAEDLRLILIRDISKLYTDMREQILLFAGVYAASVLCAVLVLFFMTGRLLRPLYRLQQTAAQISEGRLDCRTQVKEKDEIGEMAVSFNRMADRIEEQVHQLEELAEQRKQLLGSLTHELKTPLTSIIGYSDTLLHVKLKPEQHQKALQHIHEESRRLERLSAKLMQLIGLYENESIIMEETQMEELFAKAAQTMRYRLDEIRMTLDIIC